MIITTNEEIINDFEGANADSKRISRIAALMHPKGNQ